MRAEQREALEHVCDTQEKLAQRWANPQVYRFGKLRQIWVMLCVAVDGGKFVWSVSARIANPGKRNFKSVALWTTSERLRARSILIDQLDGVGLLLGEEEFESTKALHINRKLTEEEYSIVMSPQILGN